MDYEVIVDSDGTKKWYIDGNLHREDGPAAEYLNGSKEWWINGKLHREDGPALEFSNGSKQWWLNGDLHRVDGPAIECVNGYKEWWLAGNLLTKEEWFNSLSAEDKEKALFSEYFITG